MRQRKQRAFWLVFSIEKNQPTFFGLFNNPHDAKTFAATIPGARAEKFTANSDAARTALLTVRANK
jgi:hypothetical protein